MWIWSHNPPSWVPPTALRIKCKHHTERIRLWRLGLRPTLPSLLSPSTPTLLNHWQFLWVPCPALLWWKTSSVQPRPPQLYMRFIPAHFFKGWLQASPPGNLSWPFHPHLVSGGSCLGVLGIPGLNLWQYQTVLWRSGHLFTHGTPNQDNSHTSRNP